MEMAKCNHASAGRSLLPYNMAFSGQENRQRGKNMEKSPPTRDDWRNVLLSDTLDAVDFCLMFC